MKAHWTCSVGLVWFVIAAHDGRAEYVFSPLPGNGNRSGPDIFLYTSSEAPAGRVQEVHAASDFVSSAEPVLLITELSYSAPSWSGRMPIDVTLPSIEIRLSTTQKNPDGLSINFADNVGADQTVVYSGPLHFYETETETYDIHVSITPFRYDPAAGNLLVDVFNYAPLLSRRDPDWVVDSAERFGDSVSRLGGRANSVSGGFSTFGLMTRFTYTPVPEPSTWALFGIGIVGLSIARWKFAPRKR